MSEYRGLLRHICLDCRAKVPVLVGDRFRWRCDHRKLTVFESVNRRYLEFDQDSDRASFTRG